MPHIIVGTAGHIDHGKTSLVKALTGIDADRLKEEKERGITIDIGFASLRLDEETTIGFIDVPGHERFIKNMLAGVGGIDAVVLVIAADEAVMPQTREHLDICSLLHIQRGVTVLTKIDATEGDLVDLAEMEVREYLQGSFLQDAPLLRVSSTTGEGLGGLREALRTLASRIAPKDASRIFRLPIDRCFSMKGFGTVVSGTLISGRVRRDDEVEVLPAQRGARVRGIQVHGGSVDEASAGQRTALNLQRVELDQLERGMVLAAPGVFAPTSMFDVHLELLPTAAPLVRRKRIRFHIGTAEVMGYAVLLGQDVLEPGAAAFAQIRLERPTFALPGDRFIIRQYSPMLTLGGGEILDAHPPRHRRLDPAVPQQLHAFKNASPIERIATLVESAGNRSVEIADLVGRLGLTDEQVAAALDTLARDGRRVRQIGNAPVVVMSAAAFKAAAIAILGEIARFHEAEPLLKGIAREDLRGRVVPDASPLVFRALVDHLVESKQIAADQDILHAHARAVTLGGEEARIREQLADRFKTLGLQAPSPDEVMRELGMERQRARKILQLLLDEQVLVKIADDLIVDRNALNRLIADVRGMKGASAKFGVREFKELTGLSRKFAMPLLEYLDAQRVTRRVGDERLIL